MQTRPLGTTGLDVPILSFGASVKKPVVAPNGAIQAGETMILGLS